MKNVLFLTNVPSPYRVLFFNELSKYCDLTVLYERRLSKERDKKWKAMTNNNYSSVFLNGVDFGKDKSISLDFIRYLNDKLDFVVICGLSSPTEIFAIEYCKKNGIKYCFEGDGAFPSKRYGIKSLLKSILLSDVEFCFSTAKLMDDYLLELGVDVDKIVRYHFSSVLEEDIMAQPIEKNDKKVIRDNLGIDEEFIVLSVGQFIYRKGFDLLIEVAKSLNKTIGIYIVGGNPVEEYLKLVSKYNITNVHFVPFMEKEELSQYYKLADFFVLPTREDVWGLVINEAMSFGLPVITTNKCIAGLELIEDGVNGYIVETDNVEELSFRIQCLLDDELLYTMSNNSLKKIKDYTIESMVNKHIEIFWDK